MNTANGIQLQIAYIFLTVFKYEYHQRYTLRNWYYLKLGVTVYAIYEEKYIYIYFLYVVFTVTTAIFLTVFKYEYCRRYTVKFPIHLDLELWKRDIKV